MMESMQAMRTSLAVRLTEKQRSLVALAARQQGVTAGEIVRQALDSFFAHTHTHRPASTKQIQKTTAMVCKVLQQRLLQEVIHEIKDRQSRE